MLDLVVAVLAVGLAGPREGSVSGIAYTLVSERTEYLLGEPVRLTLTARNDSRDRVRGFFQPSAYERVVVSYRRDLEPFQRVTHPARRSCVAISEIPFDPGQEWKFKVSVLAEPGGTGLLLDRPGIYEFYVEARPWLDSEAVVRTNRVSVRIQEPDGSLRESLADYTQGRLPHLVQAIPHVFVTDGHVAEAVAFLDRHPTGFYAGQVRAALIASRHPWAARPRPASPAPAR